MFKKESPIEKEWNAFLKKEESVLRRYGKTKEPFWEKKLQAVVPDNLQEKLESAFIKAFQVILQNGTGIIEKTYSKEKLEAAFKVREYSQIVLYTRKNLTAARRTAGRQTLKNVAGAGAEGAALGLLGIGLPDIPLFLGVIIRSLYTLSLHYGIDYREGKEQELLLELLTLSLHRGEDFKVLDAQMNRKLFERAALKNKAAGKSDAADADTTAEKSDAADSAITAGKSGAAGQSHVDEAVIRRAAKTLSGELLYLKFLQGIPVAGIIGGIYDGIYLKKITDYAGMKLERRYLLSKMQ